MDEAGFRTVLKSLPTAIAVVDPETWRIEFENAKFFEWFPPPVEATEVELGVREEDGEVRLWVRDTGPGIAQENVARIFEPFWQAEPANTRTVGGTGLGLSVVRRLTQLLGGRLSVDTALGRGSTFSLHLPQESPAATPSSDSPATTPSGS